jgi:hypothetical protein
MFRVISTAQDTKQFKITFFKGIPFLKQKCSPTHTPSTSLTTAGPSSPALNTLTSTSGNSQLPSPSPPAEILAYD